MQDSEFLAQFENCTLPPEEFKHHGHLRLAWLYLAAFPFDQALAQISLGITRYATHLGAASIYHQTLTCFWVRLVQQAMQEPCASFDEFITRNSYLLDKSLPQQYYSSACLESELARKVWVEPDLKSLSEDFRPLQGKGIC